jgi:hydrogenase maturation protease
VSRDDKILICGVGNVLRADDGFGVRVAHALMARDDLGSSVKVIETGIGGMSLVQELMDGYDALLLIDAYTREGEPGQLYFLEPEIPDTDSMGVHEKRSYFADTHYATPIRALALASQVAELPSVIRVLGCEPQNCDDMTIGLTPPVEAAIPAAIEMALDFLNKILRPGS